MPWSPGSSGWPRLSKTRARPRALGSQKRCAPTSPRGRRPGPSIEASGSTPEVISRPCACSAIPRSPQMARRAMGRSCRFPGPPGFAAERAVSLAVVPGPVAIARTAGWRGVESFSRAALQRLRVRVARAEAAAGRALGVREEEEDRLESRVYTRLTRVPEPPRRRVAESDTEDPVSLALSMVAAAMGVQLRLPASLDNVTGLDRVDAIARTSGLRWRRVTLEAGWWHQDAGALYATLADGRPVALLPRRSGVVDLVNPTDHSRSRVDARVAGSLSGEAVMLYRPLPSDEVSGREILSFLRRSVAGDLWRLVALGLAVGLLSLATPLVTKFIFSTVVPQQDSGVLVGLTALLVIFAVGSFGFSVVERQALARMNGRVATDLQSALCDRVVDLPLGFFRRYSSGSLAMRVVAVDRIQALGTAVVATSLLAVPIGVLNLGLAFYLQPRLGLFALIAVAAATIAIVFLSRSESSHLSAATEASQASFGVAMQLVDGVGKLPRGQRGATGICSVGHSLRRAQGGLRRLAAGLCRRYRLDCSSDRGWDAGAVPGGGHAPARCGVFGNVHRVQHRLRPGPCGHGGPNRGRSIPCPGPALVPERAPGAGYSPGDHRGWI